MGILSLLLWTPAAGVLLMAFIPGQNTHIIRTIANLFTSLAFLLICWLISAAYALRTIGHLFTGR